MTRTAVVENRGDQDAQFGVEVDPSSATYVHVLRGTVAIRSPNFQPHAVPAGMCAWTGAGPNHDGLLMFRPGQAAASGPPATTFVTEVPQSPPAGRAGG